MITSIILDKIMCVKVHYFRTADVLTQSVRIRCPNFGQYESSSPPFERKKVLVFYFQLFCGYLFTPPNF